MDNVKSVILNTGIIAICRKIYGDKLALLSDALYTGGVRAMEITFDQSDPDCIKMTSDAVSALCSRHPDMCVGVGTVLDTNQLLNAYSAGASFAVSPDINPQVVGKAKDLGLVSIPGALTPTEILLAWKSGADIVKVFPASYLGLDYIKAVRTPISHVPLLAAGGIVPDNLADYISAGYSCAGISSYLSPKDLIESGRWDEISKRAKQLLDICAKTK